ncbi:TBC1 domain family member 17 isoform X1 [Populus alba x Populus x berolinensis]|nr:TBC1 domain family member 17 isoform X1 [Populus alba x Populus x berolinensis]
MWRDPGQPADSYYQVRPECTDVPKSKFKIKAGKTLSSRKWQAAFTPEGYLDISKTLGRIYRGGIHPSIRGEVWEFLLGCYDPKSTFDERDQIRQRRRVQYVRWKEECRQIFPIVGSGKFITAPVITEDGQPIQEPLVILETNQDRGPSQDGNSAEIGSSHAYATNQSRTNASCSEMVKELTSHGPLDQKVIQWMLTLHQIGLDVHRTDRTLVFYEKQENLSKLWDILAVYAWIDTDVGYCQGMSDLCSPMIMLLEDEADAFWCFERLMRRLRGNFRCTGRTVGVETQLSNLAEITQVIDPKLHQHLDALGGGDYLFAFRMLMVLFRREFSFCDSLYLWEMMWALEYDPDLFSVYEELELNGEKREGSKGRAKSIRHYGKFERENMKNGAANSEGPLPMSVFLVASVLKDKSSMLLHEARGLDDVVKGMTGELLQLEHHPFCVHVSRERFKLKFQAASISLSSCHSCALLVEELSQTPLMTLLFGV